MRERFSLTNLVDVSDTILDKALQDCEDHFISVTSEEPSSFGDPSLGPANFKTIISKWDTHSEPALTFICITPSFPSFPSFGNSNKTFICVTPFFPSFILNLSNRRSVSDSFKTVGNQNRSIKLSEISREVA